VKVTLPYDPQWKALAWAKEHCPDYITNDVAENVGIQAVVQIDYFFASERDAAWFKLRWL